MRVEIFTAEKLAAQSMCRARGSKVKLEICLYTNRPNPEVELSEEIVSQFWGKLVSLSGTLRSPPKANYGYRGMLLTGSEDYINVFDEIVEVQSPSGQRLFIDEQRLLEEWLFWRVCGVITKEEFNKIIKHEFLQVKYPTETEKV